MPERAPEEGVGEAREVIAEQFAGDQPQQKRDHDAGRNGQELPPARRQPFVHDHQCDDQHDRSDRNAQEIEHEPQRLQQRDITHRAGEDQRRQHDQERQHQEADRCDQDVADRFQPQNPPAPAFGDAIGAVQTDAQTLDAARGEVDRQRHTDGEQVAARAEQHAADLAGNGRRHLGRPHLQNDARHLIGELRGPEQEAGERGDQDKEGKQRHQSRQSDMACNRPAIIGEELVIGVDRDAIGLRRAKGVQQVLDR